MMADCCLEFRVKQDDYWRKPAFRFWIFLINVFAVSKASLFSYSFSLMKPSFVFQNP